MMAGGDAGNTWAAVLISGAVELVLNLVILAYSLGRLSERVEVLWLTVFNHLGQDAETARLEWRRRRHDKTQS